MGVSVLTIDTRRPRKEGRVEGTRKRSNTHTHTRPHTITVDCASNKQDDTQVGQYEVRERHTQTREEEPNTFLLAGRKQDHEGWQEFGKGRKGDEYDDDDVSRVFVQSFACYL